MVRSLLVGVKILIANHTFDSQVRGDERGHYYDTSLGNDRAVDYQVWVRSVITLLTCINTYIAHIVSTMYGSSGMSRIFLMAQLTDISQGIQRRFRTLPGALLCVLADHDG